MNIDEFKRLEELFNAAVELPPAQRHAYLAKACGEETELLVLVERLLDHRGTGTAVLRPAELEALSAPNDPEAAPIDHTGTLEGAPTSMLVPGERVGHYVIREQIGEGGFAIVYAADQEKPVRRKVALKIIKPGMDTRQVIARFEAERQALAMLWTIPTWPECSTPGLPRRDGRIS